uniref:Helix-turn-helix domain-containing protein n=1 Tax=Nothobranchius pienaari TaxID=704102 RepID=A0A1A8L603_9TELE
MAFLDMNIHHTDDGSIKITIYRKPTHTDQYLLWTSEHPTAHKLSVFRPVYERTSFITDETDRKQEEEHIKQALSLCQYPKWAIEKGKQQVKENTKTDQKKKTNTKTRPHAHGHHHNSIYPGSQNVYKGPQKNNKSTQPSNLT